VNEHSVMYKRKPQIKFEMLFTINFPVSPPFVRVVYPRFQQYTGHITVGGSICTPILTEGDSGEFWKPNISIPSLLLTLHQTLIYAINESGESAQAKVQNYANFPHFHPGDEYTAEEARSAFIRVAQVHGWNTRSIQQLLR
jgi:ubiquitin-conjugating enzyme E2 Q